MGKIIAIANQKGGVGKTTTAINLAAGLAYLNKRVLMVDFDPQGNATQGIGHTILLNDYTVYDALLGGKDIKECIKTMKRPPLDILPANINLAGADLEMVKIENDREKLLKRQLAKIKDAYDFIIVDCPPSLGLLNTNALEGVTQLLQTIRLVQKLFNPNLRIEGVLLTMFDRRTNLSEEVREEVHSHFKEKTYKTFIPRNIKLSEAPSQGKSIFDYDINSDGAKAYVSLTKEVLNNNQEV